MRLGMRDHLLLWWGRRHIGEVIRRRALRRALRPLLRSGMRILDAGCGRGDNALWLARRYPDVRVDAVDIDPKLVTIVQRRIMDVCPTNCAARVADIETFESDARYGIVYSVDVFEHLRNSAAALASIARALVGRGWCIIHVPQVRQHRWFRRFEHYEQHDHEREGFAPDDLLTLMRGVGLVPVSVRHTFGPPGALAWELFHLAQGVGKWFALLSYFVPWTLACADEWFRRKRGNGLLVIARKA